MTDMKVENRKLNRLASENDKQKESEASTEAPTQELTTQEGQFHEKTSLTVDKVASL